MKRISITLLRFALCILCVAACAPDKGNELSLTIKKSGCRITMDRTTGSVVYLGREENLLANDAETLFRIRFRNPDGTPQDYSAADAATCKASKRGKRLTFTYTGFPNSDLRVTLSVKADKKDGLFRFSMKVKTDEQIEWM